MNDELATFEGFEELLDVVTFEDELGYREKTLFREMHVEVKRQVPPFIELVLEDVLAWPDGRQRIVSRWTMRADNTTRIPIVDALGQPKTEQVIIGYSQPEGAEGEPAPEPVPVYQAIPRYIGEFDLWKRLIFLGEAGPLNQIFRMGIFRKKGLLTTPLAFIEP